MDDLTDHEDCGLDHGAKAYHELEAEVERLRAYIEYLHLQPDSEQGLVLPLHDAETLIEDLRDGVKLNEEYRQHAERLRAALEHIADPHGFTQPARAENMRVYARAALAEEARDPKACVVQDLDRAGNYCTVHGWHPTLECFESERLGIARDALAKEKE